MAKFVIECPHCSTLNPASTFIFAKKVIKCGNCSNEINVKANRLTSRKCPHCQNIIIYDQAKKKHECPSCHKDITEGSGKLVSFSCPECSCIIQIDENTPITTCPVCDHHIDNVSKEVAKSKLVSDTGISIIQYEGDNDVFVWKHPIEDFNFGSRLIVHESQEAVFFLNGQALDTFGPGAHYLETENLPILKGLADLPTDGQKPFHAEIYFINKTVQQAIKWGTAEKINLIDPITKTPIRISAFGTLNLQVSDARKLLIKLVGTTGGISWEDKNTFTKSLESSFKPIILSVVKSKLAAAIKQENIDILQIDERLLDLSKILQPEISAYFEEYGLYTPLFNIQHISPDETDPGFKKMWNIRNEESDILTSESEARRIDAHRQTVISRQNTELELAEFEAKKKLIAAQAEAAATKYTEGARIDLLRQEGLTEAEIMQAKGYSQRDVLQADVQKAYAQGIGQLGSNGGDGSGSGMMSDILGLGVGMAAMGTMGEKVGSVLKGFNNNFEQSTTPTSSLASDNTWKCTCGCEDNKGKFCSECGKPKPEIWDCPACGSTGNKGKFCSECGKPKPEVWICTNCGAKDNKGRFCSECGQPKEV